MTFTAVFIASLSLIVSGLSLGWQIAIWLMNGARVRVTLKSGVLGRGSAVTANVEKNGRLRDMGSMRSQGWAGPDVLAVEVTNVGRQRTKVVRYGFHQAKGLPSVGYNDPGAFNTALPVWIEPGESTTWYAELQDAVALVRVTKAKRRSSVGRVRMYVELGTGKTLVTRNAARLS
ncbi:MULTISPECIES: hypothetical protein [unclassified Cryobacterium]|uniref:hypothetical protein n=1 Tax=unclassified Cryobacterium TaxID=2649013 RepID=UPI00106B1207|nr:MULTISPECIES: hypothetical protein [unclassified Cryobacterium]TFC57871.1 hypothetical protein E3O68_02325 [Cryobacterium sp. TMB3-1-2]TFC63260.1 hypothetical protein E3O60_00210 [Cryobacterium sp. TMB1-7]TFC75367.1 hypothetical protein E3T21_00050 [Cryobacterium sp. TMB3-15]TFC77865.1 hypothetical protein E3T22_04575 [Cryobacterium sp. TMB3-10]TFD46407.1 hypothetical protein E3T58_00820 [Cryobacterium sp. TMB3-12]